MEREGEPKLTAVQRADLVAYARAVVLRALGLSDEAPVSPDCGGVTGGAFVALHRGEVPCGFVGGLGPRPLAEAVADAARRAATEDARYDAGRIEGPVAVSVWWVGPSRPVTGPADLTDRDGVYVAEGLNRAVHLAGLPGVGDGPEGVLASACVAADIHPGAWRRDTVALTAFPVERLDVTLQGGTT